MATCDILRLSAHYVHGGPGAVPRLALWTNTLDPQTSAALPLVYIEPSTPGAPGALELARELGSTRANAPALLGVTADEPYTTEEGRVTLLYAGDAHMPIADACDMLRAGRTVSLRITSITPAGSALARGTLELRPAGPVPARAAGLSGALGARGARASSAMVAPAAVLRAELGACISRGYACMTHIPCTMHASTARRILATIWSLGDVDVPFAAYWCTDTAVPPSGHYLAHLLAIGAAREGLDAGAGAAALVAGARAGADAVAVALAARIYVGAITARATALPYQTDLLRTDSGGLRALDHFDTALAAKDCEDFARIIYFMHCALAALPADAPGALDAARKFARNYAALPLLCAVTQMAAASASGHDNEEAYAAHMTVLLVPTAAWAEWCADRAPAARPRAGGVLVAEGTGFVPPELVPDEAERERQQRAAACLVAPAIDALPHEMVSVREELGSHRSSFFRIALYAWAAPAAPSAAGPWLRTYALLDRKTNAHGVHWDELDNARVHAVPLECETPSLVDAARARLACETPEDAPAVGSGAPAPSDAPRVRALAGQVARVWVPLAHAGGDEVERALALVRQSQAPIVSWHVETIDERVRPTHQLCVMLDARPCASE